MNATHELISQGGTVQRSGDRIVIRLCKVKLVDTAIGGHTDELVDRLCAMVLANPTPPPDNGQLR